MLSTWGTLTYLPTWGLERGPHIGLFVTSWALFVLTHETRDHSHSLLFRVFPPRFRVLWSRVVMKLHSLLSLSLGEKFKLGGSKHQQLNDLIDPIVGYLSVTISSLCPSCLVTKGFCFCFCFFSFFSSRDFCPLFLCLRI